MTKAAGRPGLGRPFARLWGATATANLADGMLLAGLPVLATTVTTDPGPVATVLTVFMTAMGMSSLPAGVVADRADGRRVLVTTNLLRTATLVGLAVAALIVDVGLVLLYAAAAICGSTEVVNDVTAETLVPTLVGQDRMSAAHGRLTATQSVLNDAVGAPIGAVLGAAGIAWTFGLPAALYTTGAIVAARLAIPARPSPERQPTHPGGGQTATTPTGRFAADVREGMRVLWSDRLLRRLAMASAALNLANTAFFSVLVLLVIGPMRLPRPAYGLLLAAVALGGLLGGALAEPIVRRAGQRAVLLLGPITIGLAYGLTCAIPHPATAVPSLMTMAAVGMVWNVTTRVLRQRYVPQQLLGRVSTSMRLISLCATPIGGATAGLVAETAGVRAVGIVTTLAATLALLIVRGAPLRRIGERQRTHAADAQPPTARDRHDPSPGNGHTGRPPAPSVTGFATARPSAVPRSGVLRWSRDRGRRRVASRSSSPTGRQLASRPGRHTVDAKMA